MRQAAEVRIAARVLVAVAQYYEEVDRDTELSRALYASAYNARRAARALETDEPLLPE